MNTDRELLKAAAKAAGVSGTYLNVHGMDVGQDAYGIGQPNARWGDKLWNPLTDDGDALRLSIYLRIDMRFEKTHSVSAYTERDEWFHEHCGQGKTEQILDKTRRAITRAAASMAA